MATPSPPGGGFVLRSKVQIGDPIRTFDDSEGRKIQVVSLSDCFGDFTGIAANPIHVQGAVLDAIEAAVNIVADAINSGSMSVDVVSSVLPTGAATELKQDDAIAVLNLLLDCCQNPPAPSGTTDVNVVSTVLPPNAATQTTLAALLAELEGKADLTETQPVSVTSSVLPTGASTEATLAAVLAAIGLLAKLTDVQPVSISGSLPLPTGAATEFTLAALLAELELKADLTETQPVSLATVPLPTGAATEAKQDDIIVAINELDFELDDVKITSSVLPTGAATEAKQDDILAELQLKADLTETQPVSVTNQITGFATQTTLAAVLAELTAKTEPADTQLVSVVNFPADRATETTLAALLAELELKANLTETQPVSVATLPLPTGAATQTTLAAVLAELTQKTEPGDTQNVNIVTPSPLVIDDDDIIQKLCDLLDELELKADLTEIQPVKVCLSALPDGAAEEDTLSSILAEVQLNRLLIKKFDETDPFCVYAGEALSGSLDEDPVWSIRKIIISGAFTDILRADGGAFTKKWDDRAILTYT